MKYVYTLFIALLAFGFTSQAQVTLFEENFDGLLTAPAGFNLAGNWSISNENASATNSSASGRNYLRAQLQNNGSRYEHVLQVSLPIESGKYKTISLNWYDIRVKGHSTQSTMPVVKFYYKFAATDDYIEIPNINASAASGAWAPAGGNNLIEINNVPATATSVYLYWSISLSRHEDYYGIDDIGVYGEQNIVSLPVELVSFKAQSRNDGVQLNWKTASEQDNKGFEVEVSVDGRNFRKIGFVASKVGTTSITQNYTFRDTKAGAGTNYYRLKQIDHDGTFEYSTIVAVNMVLATSSTVYPTLASDQITVNLALTDETVTIMIADMAGKQLAAVQNPSDRQVTMPVQHLQNGVYFITVISGGQKEVFRFVKR